MTYLTFSFLGLGAGAVYGALGLALVLTYLSSGTVNLATGAIAMYVAYTFALLRQDGDLFNPFFGLPARIHIADHVPTALAMLIALLVAALFGLIAYLLIFRPLRTALPLSRVVASLGLMVLVQSVVTARLGTQPVVVRDILPSEVWKIGGLRVPEDRILLALVVIAIAVALWALMRFSRFGLMTRAVAESEKGAVLVGVSTDRIASANWALATVVAGLCGILISPVVPISPGGYTLLIVPALAAALVGRFTYFGPTVIAGLALGVVQSLSAELRANYTWFPPAGVTAAVTLAVIIGLLVVRGEALPGRGALIRQQFPKAPMPRHVGLWAISGLAALVVIVTAVHGQYRSAITVSLIMGIVALSSVIVTGYVGQISLAQLSFAGIAGFMLSRMTTEWGFPFPLSLLASALAAAAIGVVVGLPALRVRGVNLAIVTLAGAVAINQIYFLNARINGGIQGAPILGPKLFGLDLQISSTGSYPRPQFSYMVAVCFILVAAGVANLRRSRLGSEMLAVRANEKAAAAGGIDVAAIKLLAFAIGAFVAGISGALLGYQGSFVSADNFNIFIGLTLFASVYLCGITSITGGIVAGVIVPGGIFIVVLDQWVSSATYVPMVGALLLIYTTITSPGGFVGEMQESLRKLGSRRFSRPMQPQVVEG